MWLVIKDLYTNVKAKVLYAGALSREIDILRGTGQGRILAPFMYKVYINSLLKVLTDLSLLCYLNQQIKFTFPFVCGRYLLACFVSIIP